MTTTNSVAKTPKVTFLFWNIKTISANKELDTLKRQQRQNRLHDALERLVDSSEVDILLLAESMNVFERQQMDGTDDFHVLLDVLNRAPRIGRRPEWRFVEASLHEKVKVFHRLPGGINAIRWIEPEVSNRQRRYGLWQVKCRSGKTLIVAAAHFPAANYEQGDGQRAIAIALKRDIVAAEQKLGHSRTAIVGDLNASPFDPGIVGTYGLHAVATEDQATENPRQFYGESYDYFFNPMWTLFGDNTLRPSGTYFGIHSPVAYYWYILDQVLLRPALLGAGTASIFDRDSLKIMTGTRGLVFCKADKKPDATLFSDHLPLIFTLNM